MASPFPCTLALLAAIAAGCAVAAETTMTPAGFTGLSVTPSAHLLGWGSASFSYDAQLPGVIRDPSGHNFVLGFGLLPNVEIAGRLAANSIHANCFIEGCGARDLSVSAKAGIGLDSANRFRIAAGVTDVGGAATYFRSYYGVLTYNEGPWELSAGLARRSGAGINGSRSPLDGPFAGAAWQPAPWVRGHVETADGQAWAGLRLMAPDGWLPQGWAASVGANARLTQSNLTERTWLSASLTIPLYKVPAPAGQRQAPLPVLADAQRPLPAYEARALPAPETAPPVAAAPATAVTGDVLVTLVEALRARGLEDISVGRMPDHSLAIRVNNATYNWNSLDALGAALGAVAQSIGDTRSVYRLILTQRQVALVAVTGRSDCLREWVSGETQSCTAGELSTPGTQDLSLLHQGTDWVVRDAQPSWQTLRVALSPVLRTSIGTEFGSFDHSAGLSAAFVQPLWPGATAEWRVQQELTRSSDYAAQGIFYRRRVASGTDRLVLTQTVRLPLERLAAGDPVAIRRWGLASVTGHWVAGRIGGDFDGALAAMRWEPGEGRHRVTLQAGAFRHARFGAPDAIGPRRAIPVLATYRYNVAPTRTYLEATAGRFMFNDLGYQVGMRQWFSDVSVSLFYRHSRFADAPAKRFAGIQISVPIGPRRDMSSGGLQVTGTPRFTHGVETVVRDPSGSNAVVQGFGVVPPAPDLESTFNSDRASLMYFEDNMRRIRDAAR